MVNNGSLRESVFQYVKEKYGGEIEYPWARFPNYAVFRHEDNRKWYGLVMNVPKNRLGLDGDDYADILNVKMDDVLLRDVLIRHPGYFVGYHISKGSWTSILLDGTVPFEDVCKWIDVSFQATASKKTRDKTRPPKDWLIPANPKYYNIERAFDCTDVIDWKQGAGVKTGDTVFMYVAAPVSAILYQCEVTKTDVPYNYREGKLTIKAIMKIKLVKRYPKDAFTFEILKNDYGVTAIRGPCGVPSSLSEMLKNCK